MKNTLFIESHLTAQELKIDRADLSLIEFDSSARSLARRAWNRPSLQTKWK